MIYAGKGVTADGSVLIGRTVDFSPCNATMFQQICEPGTQVTFGGEINKCGEGGDGGRRS